MKKILILVLILGLTVTLAQDEIEEVLKDNKVEQTKTALLERKELLIRYNKQIVDEVRSINYTLSVLDVITDTTAVDTNEIEMAEE
jgi:hypothetical protein